MKFSGKIQSAARSSKTAEKEFCRLSGLGGMNGGRNARAPGGRE
jgi:hypothetical protein